MNTKHLYAARIIVIVLAVLLMGTIAAAVVTKTTASVEGGEEQLFCASAVCFYDETIGKECLEFDPRIVKLIPVEDTRTDSTRLVVEATGKECKKGPQ